MDEMLLNINSFIETLLTSLGIYGPLLGCVLILFESILPILPLSVFITLNFYAFGQILGFIISYVLTILGCSFAFFLSRKFLIKKLDYLNKKFEKNRVLKLIKKFSKIKLKHLVLLMAFPFTPAFMINLLAGVSDMKYKKFLGAAMIAKPFMVYFWGYLGVTLLESLTHPIYLLRVVIMLIIAYVVSTIINKKFELD